MEQVRFLSGFFRLSVDRVSGGLCGVLYGAARNPESRAEKVWALKTANVPTMSRDELQDRLASLGSQRVRSVEVRSVDAALLSGSWETSAILDWFSLRGVVRGDRHLSSLWCSQVTVVVPIPLQACYDPRLENYCLARYRLLPEVLRDRIMAYVYATYAMKGTVIVVPYSNIYSADQLLETESYLRFAGNKVRYGKE